jgi:hypothetical protein
MPQSSARILGASVFSTNDRTPYCGKHCTTISEAFSSGYCGSYEVAYDEQYVWNCLR